MVHLQWAENSWVELAGPSGEGGRPRQILTHGSVLRRTIVPLEPDGDARVSLLMHTRGTWRTWFHSPGDIPVLTDGLVSRGCYIVRPPGGRETLRVTQHDGTAFTLHALRPDLSLGTLPCAGTGAFTASATTPKQAALLYIQSRATWTIRAAGGVRKLL
ncbi:hypothetical protein [Streptomyces pristinaespiralis]|uniref:hypothetical protein n=1 Tax=Streptomyces pristinaespiralis TaxID=38300 RepID=UPI003837D7F3